MKNLNFRLVVVVFWSGRVYGTQLRLKNYRERLSARVTRSCLDRRQSRIRREL